MHIGLIGGIGPAATDFYYRGLIDRHRAAGIPLDCTIAHADVGEMGRNLADGRRAEQAAIFAGLIERMKKAGAEAAAVTSMGGHFCINELLPISPLPLVHGIHAVDAAISEVRPEEDRRAGHAPGDGDQALWQRVLGRADRARGRALRPGRRRLFGDGRHRQGDRRAAPDLLHRRPRADGRAAPRRSCWAAPTCSWPSSASQPPFPLVDCADIHVDAIFAKSIGR